MSIKTCLAGTFAGLLGLFVIAPVPALAVTGSPQWTVTSVSRPTNFDPNSPDGEDSYHVTVTNTGGASSDGSPIAITDELPQGLSLGPVGAFGEDRLLAGLGKLNCVFLTCTYTGKVVPDDSLTLTFPVDVLAGAPSTLTNVIRVSGGGAPDAAMSTPTTISSTEAGYGISPGSATTALSTLQAGAHPDLTTSIAFNTVNAVGSLAGAPKDTIDDLPPGFAGDLVDTPSCSLALFALEDCPIDTQVGITTLSLLIQGRGTLILTDPVYNLDPNPGDAAKLGFHAGGSFAVQGDVSVRAGDYGLRTTFQNVYEVQSELEQVSLTIWGVPADPLHDPLRWDPEGKHFGVSSQAKPAPFLTNPTFCGTATLEAGFTTDFWEEPGQSFHAQMPFGQIVGCDRLTMEPSLSVEATTNRAYSPTGLALGLTIPQTYENAYALATSTLTKAIVTLPEGMTVNPSAGAGLGACGEGQYAEEAAQYVAGRGCPNESKLGEVRIVSPAIKEPVTGSVFLAQPYDNPFRTPAHPSGSLLALYIVARLPERGIVIRAAGEVTPDPVTGRLVTVFDTANLQPNNGLPPLPFNELTFKFHSGATAPLVTPPACGDYTAQAELTPWAEPTQVLAPEIPPFPITSAFDDGACPPGGVPPFAPGISAGTLNNNAGSYSALDLRITRDDGEQEITGFSSQLPSGLTANLSGVPFCSEAQIALARTKTGAQEEAEPSCPVASEIGHTRVGAGVGSVLAYAPGKVYMAGPFESAPFSIAAITSAKVGPFDLGTVVVHLPLYIDPETATVSIPAGAADQIPHIIRGIVVHVRDIRVYIDRHDFMLNPTSCNPETFAATVIGGGADPANPADEQGATVTNPFQAANCQNLAFRPAFAVSTSGQTSKANGASLTAKLTMPGALGTQANIRQVKVELPEQLPSRLTTLQKACTEQVFDANPASCPAASVIGHATALTPILPVPLTGPAYFVSHGGAKFPELIVVLQGYGITIYLHGETFISKAGITSSTFHAVPDQPVTSFELTLPQGPDSALAANGNLCASTLVLPTEFVAQNGATIHQSTPIGVTGCKPSLGVLRHGARGKKATIVVSVPSAGRLLATGAGLSRGSARAARAGTVTVRMTLSKRELAFLAKHRGRKLTVKVNLLFTPTKGGKLKATTTVLIG